MPTSAYKTTSAGISRFGPLGNVNTSAEYMRADLTFVATGSDCAFRFRNGGDPGTFDPHSWRIDGGSWQDLTGTGYPGGTDGVPLYSGLSDGDHLVEISVSANSQFNPMYIDDSGAGAITVTGAAPAIKYAPNYGEVLTTFDTTAVLSSDAQRLQSGGSTNNTSDNISRFIVAPEILGAATYHWYHPNSPGATIRFQTGGSATIIELWRRTANAAQFSLVQKSTIPGDSSSHFVTMKAGSSGAADWYLMVYYTSGSSMTGISVIGASDTVPVPALLTTPRGIFKSGIVSGTSLTVTAGDPDASLVSPASYATVAMMQFGRMCWNFGYPGSCLTTPPDVTGHSAQTREPFLEAVPNTDLWLQAIGYNDAAASVVPNDFRDALVTHMQHVMDLNPDLKALVIALEGAGVTGADAAKRLAYLGSIVAPGSVRQAVTTLRAQYGGDRVQYIDSDPIVAALLAYGSDWTYDAIHPKRFAAVDIMAPPVISQARTFLNLPSAGGTGFGNNQNRIGY